MPHSEKSSSKLKAVLDAFEANDADVTGGPDNFYTVCPNHEDEKPSLSIADGKKGILFQCHAGCDQQELFEAVVAFTGLPKTAFFYKTGGAGGAVGKPVTVAELAAAKKLPLALLQGAGIADSAQGVLIPYWDGSPTAAVRIRAALKAGDGSYWRKSGITKTRITAYGAWRVPEFRPEGVLYFVEGETDTLTGWHHGLPVLGFPGKHAARRILADNPHLVAGLQYIFVIEEPDDFKKRVFLKQVRAGLSDAGWEGQVFPMRLPEKDLSDLHVERGEAFSGAFHAAWESAVDAPNWPDPMPVSPAAVDVCAIITATGFPDVFRVRDIQRRRRTWSSEQIRTALGELETSQVVRRLAPPKVVGRPSEHFRVNPKARK